MDNKPNKLSLYDRIQEIMDNMDKYITMIFNIVISLLFYIIIAYMVYSIIIMLIG